MQRIPWKAYVTELKILIEFWWESGLEKGKLKYEGYSHYVDENKNRKNVRLATPTMLMKK